MQVVGLLLRPDVVRWLALDHLEPIASLAGWCIPCSDLRPDPGGWIMSIAKVIEIRAESPRSFEYAINQGVRTASETLHNIGGAWVKRQQVLTA